MSKRMLVDASHPEETRVVILDGNRVEDFDYESAARRPLKGNIYLAKVTRVEPSLQACFVDYGGNRHGFLAFSEIHPDYYQIPTADRVALLEASRAQRREEVENEDAGDGSPSSAAAVQQSAAQAGSPIPDAEPSVNGGHEGGADIVEVATTGVDEVWVHDPESQEDARPLDEVSGSDAILTSNAPTGDEPIPAILPEPIESVEPPAFAEITAAQAVAESEADTDAEYSDDEDATDDLPRHDYRSLRRYKIQEVIKRRQVLLVQVVKEERGNKGAALTTYLSLAGRYCVLMPNTDRGGGISRKISNLSDRRKLKEVAGDLDVPEGMGVIIRTAGANRTKQEIKRDFEYLMRQWDAVRDLTLRSVAPTLVYEEGNLIKRTIRDLYSKEISDIQVEGENGFEEAHTFMSMLMPSHADSVKHYRDHLPLFQRFGVEAALDSMFNPVVRLRSGGYIVINQTEALVAVDVNSGKATREHHIEDTALKTNLEAADEIARQLRLRDLAGLVVIDFIDMEEHRNNRAVEKRLKDALRHDRARIQLGRISPFGLLEMSRQRLRAGMVEGATIPCPHCEGRGVIRSVGSMALRVLRAVEEYCQRERLQAITLRVPPEIALYILNHKRVQLSAIEDRRGVYIYIESKASLAASSYEIERGASVAFEPRKQIAAAVTVESELEANDDVLEEVDDKSAEPIAADEEDQEVDEQPQAPRGEQETGVRRRRRRRRGGRGRDRERASAFEQPTDVDLRSDEVGDVESASSSVADDGDEEDGDGADDAGNSEHLGSQQPQGDGAEGRRRRRRRGRRGRRGGQRDIDAGGPAQTRPVSSPLGHLPTPAEAFEAPDWPATGGYDTVQGAPPMQRPLFDRRPPARPEPEPMAALPDTPRMEEPKAERPSLVAQILSFAKGEDSSAASSSEARPQRKGWWQRKTDG